MKKDYYFVGQVLAQPKEVKIEIPEGHEIDKEKSTFEKIVFKKKDNKPRSWGEYCNNFKGELFYFGNRNSFESVIANDGMSYMAKDYLPSKELAKAFLAMMQIMSLRQAWIGDWEPDWEDMNTSYGVIWANKNKIQANTACTLSWPLSFPNYEMAREFLETFYDLIEDAKILI